jgi:parallel beta-helix repeat protein
VLLTRNFLHFPPALSRVIIIFFSFLSIVSFQTVAHAAPPSAPTLSSVIPNDKAATLAWGAVGGATSYNVKYGTSSGTYGTTISAGNVTSYQVINLTNSTVYYFVVSAVNADGESSNSNQISATPITISPTYGSDQCSGGTSSASSCYQGCGGNYSHTKVFDNVFNVWDGWVAAGVKTGWVEYQFASAKTISQYKINPRGQTNGNPKTWTFQGYDTGTSSWITLDTRTNETGWTYTTTRTYAFTNSTAYTRYRLNISANNGHVEVGFTEMEMMEMITGGAPSNISNLQATPSNGSVALTWSAPASVGTAITGYQVQYGTVASGNYATYQMDDATPGITITGLINFTNYQFRVIAINAYGTSGFSNSVTSTPYTGTYVSGAIAANAHWTTANSPYVVNGNLTINPGVTLTIDADVQVLFMGNYSFTVGGILKPMGDSSNPVIFSSANASPAKGDWKYIQLNNPANKLQYMTVEYSDRGIYVPSGITSPKNPVIRNNTLQNNNNGVYFEPSTAPVITSNTITNNTNGINAFCNTYTACSPTIVLNSITGNSTYNMFVQGGNASLIIHAEDNWWGSTSSGTIATTIYDHVDNASEATVDFTPYLTSTPIDEGVFLSSISVSDQFVNMRSETTDINYTIDKNANITIKIYNYATGTLIRTLLSNQSRTAGSHSESWDLKNGSAVLVPAAVYVYMIDATATDGSRDFYGPDGVEFNSPIISNTTITPDTTFSPAKGERLSMEFDLDQPAIVTIGFEGDQFISDKPLNAGTNILYWGGWDSNGLKSFWQDSFNVDALVEPLPDNGIIVDEGITLDIPTGQADPYIFRPIYNEITTVAYSISESATVTIEVRTPNGSTLLKTLESSVYKTTGSYQVVWDGRDSNGATIVDEGYYRVRILATDSAGSVVTRDVSVRVLY